MSSQQLAYVLARITLGLNFLLHGLVRIPKLEKFASGLASGFEGTWMPIAIAEGFAYILPFIEFLLGLLILIGFKTRQVLVGAAILIMLLIFGSGLKEDWGAVGTQMVYALFIFFLLVYLEYNRLALDTKSK
ncbi:DoxX family membrane protein [Autumnicola musiva]|uniref:DoxX family membrane protein n=1 Tax=Autumnicola musiva TaxID=3075589 RepID=A0ABU3D113_9FLAO|nr:DoxX family membrane protein [Zunongwangia sp. F117]MDT0675224.1 DoxX family membrane protein [Zunongwangia sp. F117]